MLPALALLRRRLPGRVGLIILSALVAHTGWHWMIERGDVLWRTEWPQLNAETLTTLARWIAGVLIVVGLVHVARRAGALLSRRATGAGE
ncbi:MAG: hypothetical protein ACXWLG_08100, partial [Myxococcaceae bacterium]